MPITKHSLQMADRQITTMFVAGLQGATPDVSEPFTMEIPMGAPTVEAPIAGTVGPMREWVGDRVIKELSRDGFSFTAKDFEKTIAIDRNAIEDDTLGVYEPGLRMLGVQTRLWRGQQVIKALEANGTCYDDKAFFATDHPEKGGNASNYTAGGNDAWYLFDTSKPVKAMVWGLRRAPQLVPLTSPDDPNVFFKKQLLWGVDARGVATYGLWQMAYKHKGGLSSTTFEAAVTSMRARNDDEGESLDVTPDLLVVPPSLEFTAKKLFGQEALANGESNIHKGGIRWIVSNRLTGA